MSKNIHKIKIEIEIEIDMTKNSIKKGGKKYPTN